MIKYTGHQVISRSRVKVVRANYKPDLDMLHVYVVRESARDNEDHDGDGGYSEEEEEEEEEVEMDMEGEVQERRRKRKMLKGTPSEDACLVKYVN